jgi:hypothetical protein
LGKKTEGKRELGRSKLRWVSNIKGDLRETGRHGRGFYSWGINVWKAGGNSGKRQ